MAGLPWLDVAGLAWSLGLLGFHGVAWLGLPADADDARRSGIEASRGRGPSGAQRGPSVARASWAAWPGVVQRGSCAKTD